jgi:hypothetical protein
MARHALRMSSPGMRPLPPLHDGRKRDMDQQLVCELNLALIPGTELASRHIA